MKFDVQPFWLTGALCAGGFGILVLLVKRGYPDYLRRTLGFLGAANLCLGASYMARYGGGVGGEICFRRGEQHAGDNEPEPGVCGGMRVEAVAGAAGLDQRGAAGDVCALHVVCVC